MPLLEVRGLVKNYGRRRVVDGVDFEVDAGEVVGLLGPNGAGKTTSFRMTTGQITPYAGAVFFNGQEVTHLPMYKRARLGMGYLSQETSVFRKLSVEQNILAILEIMPVCRTLGRALSRRERWDRTDMVLEQFGLTRVRKNNAARLSGGEKRRLEIARCLVCEPLLILLDEPFTGIDPKTIGDIQQIVRELRNQGIGVLLTDHNVREALKITTRSYLIKDGKVRTHGTPQHIIHDPIAINEYLGHSFNDNTFGGPPTLPAAPAAPVAPPPAPTAVRPHTPEAQSAPTLRIQPTTTLRTRTDPPKPATPDLPRPVVPPGKAAPIPSATGPSAMGKPALGKPVAAKAPPPAKEPPRAKATELAARPAISPTQMILEQEKIQGWIEQLKTPEGDQAAGQIMRRGALAIPVLLAALERRDVEIRRFALEVLQKILKRPLLFDPYAPEALRKQQISLLRDQWDRKAG